MIERKERQVLLQQQLRRQLLRGRIDRREFVTRTLMAGLGMAGAGVAARLGMSTALAARPLTPTFYNGSRTFTREFRRSTPISRTSTTR
jgi:hypothetical protein